MYKKLESNSLNKLIANYKMGEVLIQFTFLVFPLSMYLVYNKIIASKNPNGLLVIMLFLLFIILLQLVLKIITTLQKNIIKTDLTIKKQERYLENSISIKQSVADNYNKKINTISDLNFDTDEIVSSESTKSFYVFICFYFILIMMVGGFLIIVPAIMFTINYILMKNLSPKYQACKSEFKASQNRKNEFLKEVLLKTKIIKCLNISDKINNKYKEICAIYNKNKCQFLYLSSLVTKIPLAINIITMSLIIIFGRYLFSLGMLSIEEVIACSLLTAWISKAIAKVFATMVMTEGKDNKHSLSDQINNEDNIENTDVHGNSNNDLFTNELSNTIDNIINTNESIVYIDKNTNLDKICHMLILNEKQCAFINNDFQIFYGSILDNITLFNSNLENTAKKLCTAIGLDNAISKLPFQYNYVATNKHDEVLTKDMLLFITIIRELLNVPDYLVIDYNINTVNQVLWEKIANIAKNSKIKIITKKYKLDLTEIL